MTRVTLEGLVKRMHDKMDDYNATRAIAGCRWCHVEGYDATGLKHADDCVLVDSRAALALKEDGK